jgi:TonB family protein
MCWAKRSSVLFGVCLLCASVAVAWAGNDRESGVTWSGPPDATAAIQRTDAMSGQAAPVGVSDITLRLLGETGETQSSPSALGYYLGLVDYKISTNWNPAASNVTAKTNAVIRFRVMRGGNLRSISVETSSGNAALDQAALDAIWKSAPFPPFPNLMFEPHLDLAYSFVTERG